jgi:hypothetical protein
MHKQCAVSVCLGYFSKCFLYADMQLHAQSVAVLSRVLWKTVLYHEHLNDNSRLSIIGYKKVVEGCSTFLMQGSSNNTGILWLIQMWILERSQSWACPHQQHFPVGHIILKQPLHLCNTTNDTAACHVWFIAVIAIWMLDTCFLNR